MTHTKEKPTAEKLMGLIQEFGNRHYAAGLCTDKPADHQLALDGADMYRKQIRTAIETLVKNQK